MTELCVLLQLGALAAQYFLDEWQGKPECCELWPRPSLRLSKPHMLFHHPLHQLLMRFFDIKTKTAAGELIESDDDCPYLARQRAGAV